MTFYLKPEELLTGDVYRTDNGKQRRIVDIYPIGNKYHGTLWQVYWQDRSVCGLEVFKDGQLVEVVQEFETKD